jgi:hypothetical protein
MSKLSADAPEFVFGPDASAKPIALSSLSAVAAEFVPMTARAYPTESTTGPAFTLRLDSVLDGPAHKTACQFADEYNYGAGYAQESPVLMNLDQYSDDSSDDDTARPATLQTTKSSSPPTLVLDQFSDDSSDDDAPRAKGHALTKVTASPTQRVGSPTAEPAAEPTPSPDALSKRVAGTKKIAVKKACSKKEEVQPKDDDGEALPAGWYKKESSKYGRFYYVNNSTGKTSWTKPELTVAEQKKAIESENSETEPEAEATAEEEVSFEQISPPISASLAVSELLRWRQAASDEKDVILISAAEMKAPAPPPARSPQFSPSEVPGSWRRRTETAAAAALQVSESSWASQQRARRASSNAQEAISDEEFTRKIKSILNKLTIEKFPQLSRQLLECEFGCVDHVNILIKEIFEKATTQHPYIDMYTELCELLHEHFSISPVSTDPKCGFKRLLLNECQRSFERNLDPPDVSTLDAEERTLAEVRYKTRMLGNIRFVGTLLSRHMLASKVLITILQDLMDDPTSEALETVAALLTVTGPVFDTKEWSHHSHLVAIFDKLSHTVKKKDCCQRVRCLLQDVLETRARGWQDRKAKRVEAPTTLEAVAQKAKEDSPRNAVRNSVDHMEMKISKKTRSEGTWR